MKKIIVFIASLFILVLVGITIYDHERDKFLFSNIEDLNQYLASHNNPELNNVKLVNKSLIGVHMPKGSLSGMDWKEVDASYSDIENTIIENSVFTNVNFNNSTFRNVVFKNVKFISTAPQESLLGTAWFDNSKLENVHFINCVFEGEVKFRNLQYSTITIIDSKLADTDFNNSIINLNIINSKLERVSFIATNFIPDFTMQNGILENSAFESTHVREFKLDGVKTKNVGLNIAQAITLILENSELDFGMNDTNAEIQDMYVSNDQIKNFGITDGSFKNIFISNCKNADTMELLNAKIQKLIIKDSNVKNINFADAIINNALFDNVHMQRDIDLTNTKIKTLQTRNLTWDQNDIKVNTKDSNLEFTSHGLRNKPCKTSSLLLSTSSNG